MTNEDAPPPPAPEAPEAPRPTERDARTERGGQTDGAASQRQRSPAGRTPLFGR
jgi:hypothetical protein